MTVKWKILFCKTIQLASKFPPKCNKPSENADFVFSCLASGFCPFDSDKAWRGASECKQNDDQYHSKFCGLLHLSGAPRQSPWAVRTPWPQHDDWHESDVIRWTMMDRPQRCLRTAHPALFTFLVQVPDICGNFTYRWLALRQQFRIFALPWKANCIWKNYASTFYFFKKKKYSN